jgi:hypothetical protein
MSDDVVITAEGLGKKYRIQHQAQRHPYTVHRPLLSQPSTPEPPFKVQGSRFNVGCWMLDVGCWMLDVGCWMLDVEGSMFRSHRPCVPQSVVSSPSTVHRPPSTVHRPLLSQPSTPKPSTTEPPFKVQGSMLDVGCSMFGPDLPNPQPPPVRGLVVRSPVVPFLLFQEMHYLPENVLYGIFAAR